MDFGSAPIYKGEHLLWLLRLSTFHSPDGKEHLRADFSPARAPKLLSATASRFTSFPTVINPIKNTSALFYGAFIARNKGIKRKLVDDMLAHIEDKEGLMAALMEMYADSIKALVATDEEDKTAKNATWEIV